MAVVVPQQQNFALPTPNAQGSHSRPGSLTAPLVRVVGGSEGVGRLMPDAYCIGPIRISPPVVLAPMADVTNGPYRRLVKRIGEPGLVVTELISTTAIHYKSARTMSMFDVTEDQRPLAVQLFGADPEIMAEAARVAVGEGADIVDIN